MRGSRLRLSLAVGAVVALAGSATASAQNYYSAGDGLRFGVFGQIGVSDLKVTDQTAGTNATLNNATARFGGTFGYDWRFNRTVLGVEADGAVANSNGRTGGYTFANDYYASFRGRLGYYVQPDILAYGTLGLGLTGFEYKSILGATIGAGGSTTSAVTKIQSTLAGFAVGGGAEYDLYGMRLFSEYLFTTYERQGNNSQGQSRGNALSIDQTSHQFRLGIKFNLNPEYDARPYK